MFTTILFSGHSKNSLSTLVFKTVLYSSCGHFEEAVKLRRGFYWKPLNENKVCQGFIKVSPDPCNIIIHRHNLKLEFLLQLYKEFKHWGGKSLHPETVQRFIKQLYRIFCKGQISRLWIFWVVALISILYLCQFSFYQFHLQCVNTDFKI